MNQLVSLVQKEIRTAHADKRTATFVTVELLEKIEAAMALPTDPAMPIAMPPDLHLFIRAARAEGLTTESGSRLIYDTIRKYLAQPRTMFIFYATLKHSGELKMYKYLRKEKAEESVVSCSTATDTWSYVSPVSEVPFENSDNRVNTY